MFTHSPINLAVANPAEMKGPPPPRQLVAHLARIMFDDVNISHGDEEEREDGATSHSPPSPAEQQRLLRDSAQLKQNTTWIHSAWENESY